MCCLCVSTRTAARQQPNLSCQSEGAAQRRARRARHKLCWGLLQAVLTFLLARAGVFAGDDAHTLFTNQLRTGAAQFDNLQSKRCVISPHLVPVSFIARLATADPGIPFKGIPFNFVGT